MCNSNEFEYYCQVIMCCVSFCNSYYLLRMKNIQHAHRFFSSFPYYPHFSIYLPWFIGKFSFNAPVSRLQIKAKQILSFESSSNGCYINSMLLTIRLTSHLNQTDTLQFTLTFALHWKKMRIGLPLICVTFNHVTWQHILFDLLFSCIPLGSFHFFLSPLNFLTIF